MLGGIIMPKDTDILGIVFLLILLNKKTTIFSDLHRMAEVINKLDRVTSTVNTLPDINQMAQKIGPLMSLLNSNTFPSYDNYEEENRNAIF